MTPDTQPIISHLDELLVQGTRWAPTGDTPAHGMSCYGLVRYVYHLLGVCLPDTPEDAAEYFLAVQDQPQPFDVLCVDFSPFRLQRHLAVLLEPPRGYHCAQATNGLARFSTLDGAWRRLKRRHFRDLLFVQEGGSAPAAVTDAERT
jgi:hypothetical protein